MGQRGPFWQPPDRPGKSSVTTRTMIRISGMPSNRRQRVSRRTLGGFPVNNRFNPTYAAGEIGVE